MNKIFCDVCGTSYPETANQCPICGNAKSEGAGTSGNSVPQDTGYAYVKGGRFSHRNVRKRNNGKKDLPRTVAPSRPVSEKPVPKKTEETPAPQVVPVPELRPEPQPEPQPAPRPEPQPEVRPEPQPVQQPEPEPQPVVQPAPRPEPPVQPKQEREIKQPAPVQEVKVSRM